MLFQFLESVSPDRIVVFLMLLTASAIAALQAIRYRTPSTALLPCAATLGSAATLLPAAWGLPMLITSGIIAWRAIGSTAPAAQAAPSVPRWAYLLAWSLTAFALCYRLGSFSPEILTWEGSTIDGLAEDLGSGRSMLDLAVFKTLWSHAPISSGNDSLLFGLPALLLFKLFSTSVLSLRAVSVVYFLLACAIFARFTGRLLCGITGLAALAILCFSEPSLLYARYGSSMAATLCALVIAFALCNRLTTTPRYTLAILAPLAIFLATLGYSPARIPAVVLTVSTPIALLAARSIPWRRRYGMAAIFSAIIVGVLTYQAINGRLMLLFSGRGEQFFGMTQTGWFPPRLSALRSLSNGPAVHLTPGERVGVAIELVRQVTGKELSLILSPFAASTTPSDFPIRIQTDPPYWKVLPAVLAPFAVIGFVAVLRRKNVWLSVVLVSWVLMTCTALLLTNRVDTHRAFFLVLPLALCAAAGLDTVYQSLRRLIPPTVIGAVAVSAVVLLALVPRVPFLYAAERAQDQRIEDIVTLSSHIQGPLMLATSSAMPVSVRLALLEQQRATGADRRWLPEYMATRFSRGFVSSRKDELVDVRDFLADGGTLVATPPASFMKMAFFLTEKGAIEARVVRQGNQDFLLLSKKPSPALDHLAPVVQIPEPPTFPRAQLSGNRTIPLSSVKPLRVRAPVSKPQLNKSHDGNPLRIGGAEFTSGVGLHAPAKLEFAVPPGTLGLRAVIGIDDESLSCEKSSASISVFDERGTALFESPLLRAGDPPQELAISLLHKKRISVEISDGGDGKDCDHIDLADAVWVLDPKAPAAEREGPICICPSKPL